MRLIQKVMLLLLCLAMTISLSCQTVLAEKQLDIKGEIVVWYAGASESRVELYQWAKEK